MSRRERSVADLGLSSLESRGSCTPMADDTKSVTSDGVTATTSRRQAVESACVRFFSLRGLGSRRDGGGTTGRGSFRRARTLRVAFSAKSLFVRTEHLSLPCLDRFPFRRCSIDAACLLCGYARQSFLFLRSGLRARLVCSGFGTQSFFSSERPAGSARLLWLRQAEFSFSSERPEGPSAVASPGSVSFSSERPVGSARLLWLPQAEFSFL